MTDIREICIKCEREFAPLSSARGEDAEVCLQCQSKQHQNLNPGDVMAKQLNDPFNSKIKIRDGWYALQTKEIIKGLFYAFVFGLWAAVTIIGLYERL